MEKKLDNCSVAILVANGFEESEMIEPKNALEQAGAKVTIISPEKDKVKSWSHGNWSDEYLVDVDLNVANPDDYDALVLPGGVINPDKLRIHPKAIQFIETFGKANKPIAAICHGPWTLIDAGIAQGKKMTSWPSIRIDLQNAGAEWHDKEVIVDKNLVTSRKPDDIPAFNRAVIDLFALSCGK